MHYIFKDFSRKSSIFLIFQTYVKPVVINAICFLIHILQLNTVLSVISQIILLYNIETMVENSFDQDQAQPNVIPDLDIHCLTL